MKPLGVDFLGNRQKSLLVSESQLLSYFCKYIAIYLSTPFLPMPIICFVFSCKIKVFLYPHNNVVVCINQCFSSIFSTAQMGFQQYGECRTSRPVSNKDKSVNV